MTLLPILLLVSHLIFGFIYGLINLRKNSDITPFDSKFELLFAFTVMGYATILVLITMRLSVKSERKTND